MWSITVKFTNPGFEARGELLDEAQNGTGVFLMQGGKTAEEAKQNVQTEINAYEANLKLQETYTYVPE